MQLLDECREWRLLRILKSSIAGKIAPFKRRGEVDLPQASVSDPPFDNELAFIETELLLVFEWGFKNSRLCEGTYKAVEAHLVTLCQLLDGVVNQSLVSDEPSRANRSYPKLRALQAHVETASGEFSLVNGPHPALFTIQPGTGASRILGALDRLNKCMVGICKDPISSWQSGTYAPKLPERPRMPFRDIAERVLKTLFRHFNCSVDHDVLIQLPGAGASDKLPKTLEMFLSRCAMPERWHEVHSVPYE